MSVNLEGHMQALIDLLVRPIEPLLLQAGVPQEVLRQGKEQLVFGLMRLGLEVAQAESLGTPLSQAVKDERFPGIRAVHNAVADLLALELPPELLPIIRALLESPDLGHVERIRLALARLACRLDPHRPEGAIARLFLFEAVRLNVILLTWYKRPDMMRLGIDDTHFDEVAEQEVRTLLECAEELQDPEPVKPLETLVFAALYHLQGKLDQAQTMLMGIVQEVREQEERRAGLEALLLDHGAHDAVLIRNNFGPAIGEQRVEIDRLMMEHPLLYDGQQRAALDQRLKRRITDLRLAKPPPRRQPRLIDLFHELVEDQLP